MTADQKSWTEMIFRLLSVKGIGDVIANRLLLSMLDCSSSNEAQKQILAQLNDRQRDEFSALAAPALTQDVDYISVRDSQYPETLMSFLDCKSPTVLSCRGNLNLLLTRKVGFSGSRKVSDKGIDITRDCVSQLAADGVCIVSGYAAGVDITAHYEALASGGATIIVLPEGMEHFSIKRALAPVWDWNRVLVVSEFLPRDAWSAARAMKRNNTILGLSDAMIVVEAGITGGSIDAGMKAIAGGKKLFVPFYGQWPESALGNAKLLESGARPIRRKPETQRANLSQLRQSLVAPNSLF